MALSLCKTKDLFSSREGLNLDKFSFNYKQDSQFSVFRDYLGLIRLILPENRIEMSKLHSPTESVDNVDFFFNYPNIISSNRHRIDSLDPDETSESSSSEGRGDNEVIYENLSSSEEYSPYRQSKVNSIHSNVLAQTYAQTLESLIANQSVVSQQIHNHVQQQIQSKALKNLSKTSVCVFCRNNGESREFYSSHTLKDNEGNTMCPILRAYTCPLCKSHGNQSHTIKYCPKYTPKPKTDKLLGISMPLL
uniref:CNNOS1 n=1 Tax=Hydra vulgaris TaxID=6087 RepID=Q9NDP0_HYDVU|nr:CNNOS1 [Hydra vulgaris]